MAQVMKNRFWTQVDLDFVRAHYGKLSTAKIAKRLKRTRTAIIGIAKKLGVVTGRWWSSTDLEYLRENYGKMPGDELAKKLGISMKRLYTAVKRYGLVLSPRFQWTPPAEQLLRTRHAEGYSDAEIADELGCDRHAVGRKRHALGLPRLYGRADSPWPQRGRDKVRLKTREQCRAAGVEHLGQIRSMVYRQFAVEHGWPEGIRPRAVQILHLLADRGPMTRKQICEGLGMTWKSKNFGRNNLASNDKRGSYLADLLARGLVCYQHRSQTGGTLKTGNRIPGLYMLTLRALEMLSQHTTQKEKKDE